VKVVDLNHEKTIRSSKNRVLRPSRSDSSIKGCPRTQDPPDMKISLGRIRPLFLPTQSLFVEGLWPHPVPDSNGATMQWECLLFHQERQAGKMVQQPSNAGVGGGGAGNLYPRPDGLVPRITVLIVVFGPSDCQDILFLP